MTTSPNTEFKTSARWLIAGIMAVLVVWGSCLGLGAFNLQRNVMQGALVLICVLAFLAFWGVMLASQQRTSTSQYSKASISGFILGLFALALAIPIKLSLPFGSEPTQLDLTGPGVPILVSVGLLGLSVMLSVIGLSRPQKLIGKNLGLFSLLFLVVWVGLRFAAAQT